MYNMCTLFDMMILKTSDIENENREVALALSMIMFQLDKNTMFLFALIAVWIISVASEEIRSGEYLTLQKKTFYEVPGTRVALHGYFKFCNPKTCASCFRVMYVKIGDHIICLGRRYLRYIKNCKEYSFTADAIVPKNDGKYKIMWYSPFQYGCGTIPKGERGVKVGTIHVGNPLFWIVGKNSFTAAPGDIIWVNGCYRYCKTEKLFCPNYVRQVYFNAGAGSSECGASYIADQDFVCEGKCVKRSVKVPEKPGNYSIRIYERLTLHRKCEADNFFPIGTRVGTVEVVNTGGNGRNGFDTLVNDMHQQYG